MRAAIYTRCSTRGTSKYGDKLAYDQNPQVQEGPLRAFIQSHEDRRTNGRWILLYY